MFCIYDIKVCRMIIFYLVFSFRYSCSSHQTMGGSSLKKAMFWKKKKKSPLNKAFSEIKKALPKKKKKRKSIFQKLKKDKQSKKKFSLTKDKKSTSPLLKKLSLGHKRKESLDSASGDRKEKDKGGLGRVGEQIKKKFSPENQKETKTQEQVSPIENSKEDTDKTFKMKKLKDVMSFSRTAGAKENRKLS